MARFCTGCGNEIPNGVAFCTECGAAAPADAVAAPPAPTPAPTPAPAPAAAPRREEASDSRPSSEKYGVVSTGTYFWLMLLFAVPVVGWLVCIIMAFASKNENKKHFAKAMLIWLIVGVVLAVVGYFVFRWMSGMLTSYINTELGGQFGDMQDMLEQFNQLEGSGFALPVN